MAMAFNMILVVTMYIVIYDFNKLTLLSKVDAILYYLIKVVIPLKNPHMCHKSLKSNMANQKKKICSQWTMFSLSKQLCFCGHCWPSYIWR